MQNGPFLAWNAASITSYSTVHIFCSSTPLHLAQATTVQPGFMPYDAAATPPPGKKRVDNQVIDLRLVCLSKYISLRFHLCCLV